MLQNAGVFNILTCKCASRHSGVFPHFDLPMCFAPQPRAIFEHRNFQNWSEIVVFCAFWLENVLRATAACHFSTSEPSKSTPTMRCVVHFHLTMWFSPQRRAIFQHRNVKKCSDHEVFCAFWPNNVVFATAACHFSPVCWTATSAPAALASLLFEHQEPRIIEKTQRFATSLTFFAHVPSFEWRYTRVDLLSADLTSLLCLTPLLCFSTLHIVGS